ncbi:YcxB family protein [Exiguobacterium aestuarii]|uniref:YcxB family protein n=1 Tax=Exiguobacterium aestuarii TaxID=273527 RepID=A0ABW2PPE0_9BACL
MLQIPWGSIDKASQDEKHLYLYFQEADAIIIPQKNQWTRAIRTK